ncbi:alkaline phytoceramidase [Sistotremastrum niveocremeum HHB9708]|uniref:Alkaline phytoceramidase n=1 Tax=Sistotremastrum niveocremeum HHB9708 TaxID=1314777 RepID=A0A164URL4_9AGAM|nr:alkaline phytoceramidase [Sistotremastrum niveocremeum HHB9708]
MTGAHSTVSTGYWGPVTATLDWCEANYQFSHYVAEVANTFSNLFSISLALYGWRNVSSLGLGTRYHLTFLIFALVGVGSFAFHATLLYEAQMADEIPMIWSASQNLFTLYDISPAHPKISYRKTQLIYGLIVFNIVFTTAYWYWRNPVFHQVVFAFLMLAATVRTRYLRQSIKGRISPNNRSILAKQYALGFGLFALGFVIWNVDNIYCGEISSLKRRIGWPSAFLLEGHAWWHIFTGYGSYLMLSSQAYLTLLIREGEGVYTISPLTSLLPTITRTSHKKDT